MKNCIFFCLLIPLCAAQQGYAGMTQGGSQEAFQEVDLLQVRQFLAGDLRLLASLHQCELGPGELDPEDVQVCHRGRTDQGEEDVTV